MFESVAGHNPHIVLQFPRKKGHYLSKYLNKNIFFLLFSCQIVLAAWLPAAAQSSVPGTMKEKTHVDQNGAFNLAVPIELPPGINNAQPKIDITYNSHQLSGIVGVGWSLSGLPTIERTKRIAAIDGVNGTVSYDSNDRFALQGQRLIVTNGNYGADSSVYRTEVESWQIATASGTAGSGPASFSVQSSDGSVTQFGGTTDSRILAQGRSDVRSWAVNRKTDANGNVIDFSYTTDPLNSGSSDYRAYPLQIAYTANGSHQADRFVRFTYEPNPEAQRIYIGGSVVLTNARVSHIQTFVGDTLVSDYRLTYDMSAATNRSRLISVARYSSTSTSAEPLSPTTFTYSDGALAYTGGKQSWLANAFSKAQGWNGTSVPFTVADVNGDGFLDIVGFSFSSGVQVALGSASSFGAPTQWINNFSASQGWSSSQRMIADINGDGLADIVAILSTGVVSALSDGAKFNMTGSALPFFSASQGWTTSDPVMLGDVNGDHIMDIVGVKNGTAWVALGTGDGTFSAQQPWITGFGVSGGNYKLTDMNGDGSADLIVVGNNQAIQVALSTGSGFDPSGWGTQNYRALCQSQPVTATTPIMISDVNGDGLSDIIAFCDKVYVTLSTGTGFDNTEVWNTTFAGGNWSASNQRMLADVNGDGLADLVGVTANGVIASISNGHGFIDNIWNNNSLPWPNTGSGGATTTTRLMGDANADGLADMVGIGDTNVYVGVAGGPMPDLMTGAVRSAGGSYNISYAPLSDAAVYQETQPTALSQFQNYPPIQQGGSVPTFRSAAQLGGFYHVVSSMEVKDNPAVPSAIAFDYTSQFSYQNGLFDTSGRGWMGFANTVVDNGSNTRRKVHSYLQDFPFTGKSSGSTVYDRSGTSCVADGTPFAGTASTYQQVQTATSSSPQATPIWLINKTEDQKIAYNQCSMAHQIGTGYTYDSYGNVTVKTEQNLVDANGNPVDPSKVVYTLGAYINDTSKWHLGVPTYVKISSVNDLSTISQFKEGVDFSLSTAGYDANYNLLSSGKWDDQNNIFLTNNYTYDGFGNQLTATTPAGAVTTTAYDATYQTYPVTKTTTVSSAHSLTWQYGYDPRFGKVSISTDPNNVTRVTCFDEFGRLSAEQGPYPDNRTTGNFDTPCASSLVVGQAPPSNVLTLRAYARVWSNGLPVVNLSQLTDWPTGSERNTVSGGWSFDGLGRKSVGVTTNPGEAKTIIGALAYSEGNKIKLAAVPYFEGDTVQFVDNEYDVLGRPLKTTQPFGENGTDQVMTAKGYTATATGSQVVTTAALGTADANTVTVDYTYVKNRSLPATSAFQGITSQATFQYNLIGQQTGITSPVTQNGTTLNYSAGYDSLGRVITQTDPTRGTTTSSYLTSGFLGGQTQPSGSFTYSYDLIGRLLTTIDSDGHQRSYTYDDPTVAFGQNRLTSALLQDSAKATQSQYDYSYTAYGKSAQTKLQVAGVSNAYDTEQVYDPLGRLIQVTNPDNSVINSSFSGSRLSAVSLANGAGATFSNYSATGVANTVAYGNGVTTSYTRNIDRSIRSLTVTDASKAILLGRGFGWNKLGQLLTLDDTTSGQAKSLLSYQYTGLRLAAVTDAATGSTTGFSYDDAGNMTGYQGSSYTYSGSKALSAVGTNGFTAAYDTMGNMTTLTPSGQSAMTMAFDMRGQMTNVLKAGDQTGAAYSYDYAGRHIASTMPDGSQKIYVSPWYTDVISNGSSSPVRTLFAGQTAFAQWGSSSSQDGQVYLHADDQRSTLLTSDASGKPVSSFAYSPLGVVTASGGANSPFYLYTGKELDTYTGLYWMGSRSFHPIYGRFNKADDRLAGPPLRQDALNDNAYVFNSPASYIDPSGHAPIGVAGGVCWMVAGGTAIAAGATTATKHNTAAVVLAIGGGAVGTVCGAINIWEAYQNAKNVANVPPPGGAAQRPQAPPDINGDDAEPGPGIEPGPEGGQGPVVQNNANPPDEENLENGDADIVPEVNEPVVGARPDAPDPVEVSGGASDTSNVAPINAVQAQATATESLAEENGVIASATTTPGEAAAEASATVTAGAVGSEATAAGATTATLTTEAAATTTATGGVDLAADFLPMLLILAF
ncbi:FG-GAP-like repeat-containing protein [Rhizobium sp. LEGMi135b]